MLYSPTQHGSKLSFHLPLHIGLTYDYYYYDWDFFLKGQTLIDRLRWRKKWDLAFNVQKLNVWIKAFQEKQNRTRDDIFEWIVEKKRAMEITLIQNRDRKKCSMKKNLFTCNRRFKNQWIRSKRNHWSLFLTCWFIWIGYNSKIPKRPWRLSIISINDC